MLLAAEKADEATLSILIKHAERILYGHCILPTQLYAQAIKMAIKSNNANTLNVLITCCRVGRLNCDGAVRLASWQDELAVAVQHKNAKLVELILQQWYKEYTRLNYYYETKNYLNSTGESPLHFAVRNNLCKIIALLAKTNLLESRNSEVKTPLSLAVELQNSDAIKILLNQKANIYKDVIYEGNPYAIYAFAMDSGNQEIIDLFNNHVAMLREQFNTRDKRNINCLVM